MSCPDAPTATIVNTAIAANSAIARAARSVFKTISPPYLSTSLICISHNSLACLNVSFRALLAFTCWPQIQILQGLVIFSAVHMLRGPRFQRADNVFQIVIPRLSCVLQSMQVLRSQIAPLETRISFSAKFRSGVYEFAFPHSENFFCKWPSGHGRGESPRRARSLPDHHLPVFVLLKVHLAFHCDFKELVRLR